MASLLILISDPISSAIFSNKEGGDVNNSYWAKELQEDTTVQQSSECTTTSGSRLRNAHKFNTDILPSQARIVIVGGGFAGLHTALALAEKMSTSNNDKATVDDGSVVRPPAEQKQPSKQRAKNSWYQWPKKPFINTKSNNNAKLNSEIIILEANQIGTGSSGRAKGLVVPGFQVPLEDLEEGGIDYEGDQQWTLPLLLYKLQSFLSIEHPRYTKEVVQEMYKLSYIALDRLRQIVDLYDIDCDWIECGAVEGSIHPFEEEDEEGGGEDSDGCRILTKKEVNKMMGRSSSDDDSKSLYQWGEYDPGCAGVNPLKLTLGLANAVERWGVRIYEHTKVVELKKTSAVVKGSTEGSKGKYMITTTDGNTIQCDHVVLCTGAETLSKEVSSRLERSLIPIYTWMAATEPLYDECPLKDEANVIKTDGAGDKDKGQEKKFLAPMCGDDHVSLNYWRNNNKDDGRLLFGSLADTFILPDWLVSWRLRNALKEVYPQLGNVRFDHIWGGKLAFALNAMPLIGRDTDYDDFVADTNEESHSGVWYATGFGGHGIVPTAMAGSVLANAILEIPNQQQWQLFQTYFPPSSFNGYPYSRLGAGMILSIYNLWEWLGKKGLPLPALPKLW